MHQTTQVTEQCFARVCWQKRGNFADVYFWKYENISVKFHLTLAHNKISDNLFSIFMLSFQENENLSKFGKLKELPTPPPPQRKILLLFWNINCFNDLRFHYNVCLLAFRLYSIIEIRNIIWHWRLPFNYILLQRFP